MSQLQTQTQSARRVMAAALTAFGLAFVAAVVLLFGPFLAAVVAITIPVCLLFLWLSADVVRADELRPGPAPERPRAIAADAESVREHAPSEQHAH